MKDRSRKIIKSERVSLINCDEELLEMVLKGDDLLAQYLNIQIPNKWSVFGKGVFKYVLDKVKELPNETMWLSYLPIDNQKKVLIGNCGYKGEPDERGIVEIGYEVAKKYRNQGYATEITELLVKNAFEDKRVLKIQAHTLAEKNASVRVLEKCDFQFMEAYSNNENGLIWKWMKGR